MLVNIDGFWEPLLALLRHGSSVVTLCRRTGVSDARFHKLCEVYGDGISLYALQFEPDRMLSYYVALALWAIGLYIWWRVDRSMDRYALDAASQDEDAASSVGINVTREKLKITAISAGMCAVGGAIYAQYQMYIGPDTIAGLGVSLNIVFAVIAGGMWVMLGPTVGAVFTQVLSEVLRVSIQSSAGLQKIFGSAVLALDTMIYGLLLILFIIYMPKGILGTLLEWREKKSRVPDARQREAVHR